MTKTHAHIHKINKEKKHAKTKPNLEKHK